MPSVCDPRLPRWRLQGVLISLFDVRLVFVFLDETLAFKERLKWLRQKIPSAG